MKAEDLRIGNWVKAVIDGEPVKVDWLVLKHISGGNIQSVYDPKPVYDPIPLTEEVLRKAGFEKDYNGYCHESNISLYVTKDKDFMPAWLDKPIWPYPVCNNKLDSLHQLQNLYFALTGQELRVEW